MSKESAYVAHAAASGSFRASSISARSVMRRRWQYASRRRLKSQERCKCSGKRRKSSTAVCTLASAEFLATPQQSEHRVHLLTNRRVDLEPLMARRRDPSVERELALCRHQLAQALACRRVPQILLDRREERLGVGVLHDALQPVGRDRNAVFEAQRRGLVREAFGDRQTARAGTLQPGTHQRDHPRRRRNTHAAFHGGTISSLLAAILSEFQRVSSCHLQRTTHLGVRTRAHG
jgi:hypothetical protein